MSNDLVKFIKTREVKNPIRGTENSSGIDFFVPDDLYICKVTPILDKIEDVYFAIDNEEGFEIKPGEGLLIPTGIKLVIRTGYDLVFDNKSGVATKKGLIIGAKVVDSDYRGEVHIHVINTSNSSKFINRGEKLTQGVVRKVELNIPQEITHEEFEQHEKTERGEGGFGSTGV